MQNSHDWDYNKPFGPRVTATINQHPTEQLSLQEQSQLTEAYKQMNERLPSCWSMLTRAPSAGYKHVTTQRTEPTSLARSCSVLSMELSRGRRDARSPHHGQSLIFRNTAKFFWMHSAASLRICRRKMGVYGVHLPGKGGRGQTIWRKQGHSLISVYPRHLQHRPVRRCPTSG